MTTYEQVRPGFQNACLALSASGLANMMVIQDYRTLARGEVDDMTKKCHISLVKGQIGIFGGIDNSSALTYSLVLVTMAHDANVTESESTSNYELREYLREKIDRGFSFVVLWSTCRPTFMHAVNSGSIFRNFTLKVKNPRSQRSGFISDEHIPTDEMVNKTMLILMCHRNSTTGGAFSNIQVKWNQEIRFHIEDVKNQTVPISKKI